MPTTLRLIKPDDHSASGASLRTRQIGAKEQNGVLGRLNRFLEARPADLKNRPIRVLDLSPVGVSIASSLRDPEIAVTRLAESEVAGELMRERDPEAAVLVSTLDQLQSVCETGAFEVVHTALVLGSRRELPMMTALAQLARAAGGGFVWTDRVRQALPLRARRVRDLASRVDLGFCSHKKPIASPLFTLSGWRPLI